MRAIVDQHVVGGSLCGFNIGVRSAEVRRSGSTANADDPAIERRRDPFPAPRHVLDSGHRVCEPANREGGLRNGYRRIDEGGSACRRQQEHHCVCVCRPTTEPRRPTADERLERPLHLSGVHCENTEGDERRWRDSAGSDRRRFLSWARIGSSGRSRCSSICASGVDILIEPEPVLRIVLRLYLDEALIVRAERRPNERLVPTVTQVIQVHATGRVRL